MDIALIVSAYIVMYVRNFRSTIIAEGMRAMSDYRRLISYIYAYEGGEKGKNIGFAKIDMRGPQCRIQVNVKKVYVGSSDVGVYLLHAGGELLLGRIFIRSGAGEYRTQVQSENVDGSGLRMEDCYGLTIHEVENAWQSYTTIWEDAVAQTAEIQLAEVTAENLRKQKEEQVRKGSETQVLAAELEGVYEKSEAAERNQESVPASDQVSEPVSESISERITKSIPKSDLEPVMQETAQELPISAEIERELEAEEQKLETTAPWGDGGENADKNGKESVIQQTLEDHKPQPRGPEDTARLAELDREENEELADTNIWKKMSDLYTKVLAFDYDNGCEILSIKPQDIGLLPREVWTYGNNSFLLHGYYNYRHLILAKLLEPQQPPRYLLGVPGHYFSNEKYMASMFGFPHFVLARKQPQGDGRFGYWYTDIRL